MKAIIPAAGLGTRFLPVTKAQPKEMLPVVDKPIMQYVIEEAVAGGAEHVLLVTGRGKLAIENHFDRNAELEQSLEQSGKTEELAVIQGISDMAELYYVRQKSPKGLGHAVGCGQAFVNHEPFYVLLGDVIVPDHDILPRMLEVHKATGASVIAVEPVPAEMVSRYGVIGGEELDDGTWRVTELVEKPPVEDAPSNLAIFGRYLLSPRVMDILASTQPGRGGEIQLTDALVTLLEEEPIYAVVIEPGTGFDTGNVVSWLEANVAIALRDERFAPALRQSIEKLIDATR